MRGGTVDDPDMPNLSTREAHHTHTYIHTSSAIGNPPQGGGFWKSLLRDRTFETYIPSHTCIHTNLALKNPPQGEGFWKTLHRERVFETYIPTSQSAVCYKYAFKTTLPVRGFCKANPKAVSLWGFLHFHHILEQLSMYVPKPLCLSYLLPPDIHTYSLSSQHEALS